MAKRIILISSFPLLVAIAIIAIALASIGHGQPAVTPADIEQAKSQVRIFTIFPIFAILQKKL